ncbi:MAG TPA: glutaredoxin family protein [Candidatus Kapabacteria bacterium]|nr:glutaredoxin family protein [Candidatus Kapabacteria bacterium]
MKAKPVVQFITKEEGCSLCDDAFAEIESAMDYVEFDLDIVKISEGDELWTKYWDKIPVILINGKVAFKYRTSRDALIRKLK